jgi:hypothetical protein
MDLYYYPSGSAFLKEVSAWVPTGTAECAKELRAGSARNPIRTRIFHEDTRREHARNPSDKRPPTNLHESTRMKSGVFFVKM